MNLETDLHRTGFLLDAVPQRPTLDTTFVRTHNHADDLRCPIHRDLMKSAGSRRQLVPGEMSAMRFRSTAASERATQWERKAARQQFIRRALLVFGVLCLILFGIIGAVIANRASSDTSATTDLAIKRVDWHGVPLHPDAVFLKPISMDSSQYTVTGDAANVGDWFERQWTALGLRYVEACPDREVRPCGAGRLARRCDGGHPGWGAHAPSLLRRGRTTPGIRAFHP
jgi:hypothetical protein